MSALLIYCEQDGPRLRYIAEELFGRRLGLSYRLVSDLSGFREHSGMKICYAVEPVPGTLHIRPSGLLEEEGILHRNIKVEEAKWWRYYFFGNNSGPVPFDVLSAAFYLLSRYEEYDQDSYDEHGRFDHRESLAWRSGFLEIPLVDTWAQQLAYHLHQLFPGYKTEEDHFEFISTIDIDFAYRYIGIGIWRQLKKLGRALTQLRLHDASRQVRVMLGFKRDPYDTYDFIRHVCEENRVQHRYFVLLRTGNAFDRNIKITDPLMSRLISKLAARTETGLHPSYYSSVQPELYREEKQLLARLAKKESTDTRQHYLRFVLPGTYRELEAKGFTDEYSMAYSGACGFRASTAKPFLFFDPVKNETSTLLIHPPCVMDTTLRFSMGLSPEQAMRRIEQLMNEVFRTGGTFISIWHNSNLGREDGWEGWREVFEKMHTLADSKQNREID